MASLQRNQSFAILVVSLFLGGSLSGCSEKSSAPAAAGNTGSKTKTDTDTGTEDGNEAGGDNFDDGGAEEGKDTDKAFDLCTELMAKKDDIDGFATYLDELCGSQNKLPSLRKADNVYKGGGSPKLLKGKPDKGDGTVVSVRMFTSTLVEAKATDYFALVRLQVSKPEKFAENYEHDDLIKLTDVTANSSSSKFTYDYTDGEGRVAYKATARFYSIRKGQAFVSATTMDEKIETMKSFKGLIIVNQADSTHTEIFTMSDQSYEVAKDQDPDLYDQSATKKAGKEQLRMYNNADKANEAPGLLK